MSEFTVRCLIRSWVLIYALSAAILAPAVFTPAAAQDDTDWWFDIEFIAFKRDMLPNHPEDFRQTDYVFSDLMPIDLFTPDLFKRTNQVYRLAAALPDCDKEKRLVSFDALTTADILALNTFDLASLLDTANKYRLFSSQTNQSSVSTADAARDMANAFFIDQQLWLSDKLPQIPALSCTTDLVYTPFSRVPQSYFANTPYLFGQHRLLANEAKYLESFATRIFAQRDITPLIYTAWRQPVVFGQNKASFYRVYAGQLLNASGKTPSTAPLNSVSTEQVPTIDRTELIMSQLSKLEGALESSEPVVWEISADDSSIEQTITSNGMPQWELDGLFKVYLENVNRVPYLHVDTEFKHTRLDIDASGNPILQNYPSKQRRRVISKQIHYFDHPAFGIIIRLERYQVPPENSQTQRSE